MEKINLEPKVNEQTDGDLPETYKSIPGWGVDANPKNNPAYPMKNWTGADHERLNYERPEQQPVNMEVLKSIERPRVTSVFGTSTPPQGISGSIRRFAFRYSESTYKHWVPLVLADRIDVFQGIADDLKKGIVPNIFAEKGWQAQWKYNRAGFVKNIVVTALLATVVIRFLRRERK